MSEIPEIDPAAFNRPPELTEADFVGAHDARERAKLHQMRVAAVVATISVGATVKDARTYRDWLDTIHNNETWGADRGTIEHRTIRNIFNALSIVDAQTPDVSVGAEVAAFVNETKSNGPQSVPIMRANFAQSLLLVGLRQRGLRSSEEYRLLHHGRQLPEPEMPLHKTLDDFLENHVDLREAPPIHAVLPNMLAPITQQTRPIFRAVMHLVASHPENQPVSEPSKLIQTAVSAAMHLFEYIDTQTGGNTNAAKIVRAIKSQRAKTPYKSLEARGIGGITPFTAFTKLANKYSPVLGAEFPLLDDASVRDLPRALDRLLHIATRVGPSAPRIVTDPKLRATITDVRGTIDEVIALGVNHKIGPAPLSLQEAILALGTYMPLAEIPMAVQRLQESEQQTRGQDAYGRRLHLLRQWKAARMREPGSGIIS